MLFLYWGNKSSEVDSLHGGAAIYSGQAAWTKLDYTEICGMIQNTRLRTLAS